MDDVRTVMAAVESERAAVFGISEGAPMCVLFAATYPERTEAVIMAGGYARRAGAPDHPWGRTEEQYQRWIDRSSASGADQSISKGAPSRSTTTRVFGNGGAGIPGWEQAPQTQRVSCA